MSKKALIAGASIAGLTTAWWLGKYGWDVEIFDIHTKPKYGGQTLGIRHNANEIVELMGLDDALASINTDLRGVNVVDDEGEDIYRDNEQSFFGKGNGYHILRDELIDVLRDKCEKDFGIVCKFGYSITSWVGDSNKVDVSFSDGSSRIFDLVIGADGINSGVRKLMFGNVELFKLNRGGFAIWKAPNILNLDHWQTFHKIGEHRFGVFTIKNNESLLCIAMVPETVQGANEGKIDKNYINSMLDQGKWRCADFKESVENSTDFYVSAPAQVRLDSWSLTDMPIVLVGDSGYSPSPFSGSGATLAIDGAYILASNIAEGSNIFEAFKKYEHDLRPFVDTYQGIAVSGVSFDDVEGRKKFEDSMAKHLLPTF